MWKPAQSVTLGASGGGSCLDDAACPRISLFASSAAATRYPEAQHLPGAILSVSDGASIGRHLFGALLKQLSDDEAR